ncbi:MAG: hypothetical protein NVSMB42_02980 [Herpetosiphon sp.]
MTVEEGKQSVPTPDDARALVRRVLQRDVRSIRRFPTGLCHYVYDIVTTDDRTVVARLALGANRALIAAAIGWSQRLRPLGVPLPTLLHGDAEPTAGQFPSLLLERLPGTDLGNVYPQLSSAQLAAIADEVMGVQKQVASLPLAGGYGYMLSYDEAPQGRSWEAAVEAMLQRSHTRIMAAGAVPVEVVERVATRVARFRPYWNTVEPRPFLDDVTTKNVLVHHGRFSGIVDVDMVCCGDSLLPVALTRMSLLNSGYATDYTDHWAAALRLNDEQRRIVQFYTALCCVDFLAEIGQRFNGEEDVVIDEHQIRKLIALLDRLLQDV